MSKDKVEELLIAGGSDEALRSKYDVLKTKDEFIALAQEDGYEFTIEELDAVLSESGDTFESFGNPPKRMIWWK
ncbi:Nif11-like leader peptide family natural product precursor [Desulfobulbus rhabdoformis]|jgi:predicted ribosomally synthesized peptide with nif11-like leader|uniref:Nif11-like leader peptide family natural product precursor n=1 Tax=Desulfobulbus rhabdoformis TaxID=34032 RepID=UPI001966940D|nr:Nif11-like leader peptide family natural product precursor [Desulfobulbus rhabdoformis]MBM9616103.1 Nif11-like leader peptide family natural product precursor [Desulfobulbus rhabdoformis]